MQTLSACLQFATVTAFLQTNSCTSSLKTGSQWPAVRNTRRTYLCATSAQSSNGQNGDCLLQHTMPLLNQIIANNCEPFEHAVPLPSRNSRLPRPCNLLPASYHLPILSPCSMAPCLRKEFI